MISTLSLKRFDTTQEFKQFCKKLKTEDRERIMTIASNSGLTWKDSETFKVKWMRCAMAINKHIAKGNVFIVSFESPIDFKPQPVEEVQNELKVPEVENSTSRMESFLTSVERTYREEVDGTIVIGNGFQQTTNQYGKQVAAVGHMRMLFIDNMKQWDGGHYILVDVAYDDKGLVKDLLNGRFDYHGTKKWYIPFSQLLDAFKLFKNIEISKVIAPAVKRVLENIEVENINTKAEKMKYKVEKVKFKMPKGMSKELNLFQYQKTGVEFLLNNKRTILGLAVGLGKTLTSITAAKYLLNKGEVKRVLVVAPKSVKRGWEKEITKFTDEKALVINSEDLRGKKAEKTWKAAEESSFLIVNYEMIRKDEIATRLVALCPDLIITDEGHKLKSITTKSTKAFRQYWGASKYAWSLTATPFPNGKPKETYTMLSNLQEKNVGHWWDFCRDFVETETVWTGVKYIESPVGFKDLKELREKMKEIVMIRTHSSKDVEAALPKERHTTFELSMDKDQKKLYNALLKEAQNEVKKLTGNSIPPNILAMLTRLEQVALDLDLVKDKDKVDMDKLYPKVEWALETIIAHLEDVENRGIIIFCDKRLPLEKLKYHLVKNGIPESMIGEINGSVKEKSRFEQMELYNAGKIRVMLCTNAGEEGINLQHGGHTMIHLDIPWVPKSYVQRCGRIARNGQPNPYTTFLSPRMVGTIEVTKMMKVQEKAQVINQLLGENASGSSTEIGANLSSSDIKDILFNGVQD